MAAAFIRLPALLLLLAVGADAWAASSWAPLAAARAGAWQRALCAAPLPAAPLPRSLSAASSRTVCSAEWAALGGGKAVWKRVLEPGSGEMPQPGADVEIEYVATLGERDWSVEDVVAVWRATLAACNTGRATGLPALTPCAASNSAICRMRRPRPPLHVTAQACYNMQHARAHSQATRPWHTAYTLRTPADYARRHAQ